MTWPGSYHSLLTELRNTHDLSFTVIETHIPNPRSPRAELKIQLVLPRTCERCGGRWKVKTETIRGLKCERLEALAVCRGCGTNHEISFCLPELHS